MRDSYRKKSDDQLIKEYWHTSEEVAYLESLEFHDNETNEYGLHLIKVAKLVESTEIIECEVQKRGINLYRYFT